MTNHSPDACILHLHVYPDRTIQIHNIYNLTPTITHLQGSIPLLEKALSVERGGEHVILGDFNFHHPAWGSIHISITNRNLEDYLSVVKKYGLQLLLKKGTITYEEAGHQSTINLVFASSFISESLISCKVIKEIDYGSDHYPIISRLNLQIIQREEQLRRQFKKTDILKLRAAINKKISDLSRHDLDSKEKIDKEVQALFSIIQEAIEVSAPLVKISPRSKPGFDRECKKAQVQAQGLRRIFN